VAIVSLDRFAACTRSAHDLLSGGPWVPTVTQPDISPRLEAHVNLYEPGPSSTSVICCAIAKELVFLAKKRTPPIGGVLLNSGLARALAGLLSRLLRLMLPRILAGLLTLLAFAITLLRLAFVVLIHSDSPKLLKYHLNVHHSNNDRRWG
jgi:hypothetical protein